MIPPLRLVEDEVLLINNGTDATTVVDGPGGFLFFKQWTLITEENGENHWRAVGEFMLGWMGREALADVLERRWQGAIIAAPGVFFANGNASIEQPRFTRLDEAKRWVEAEMEAIVNSGPPAAPVSMVVVIGPGGVYFELVNYNSDKQKWEWVYRETEGESDVKDKEEKNGS